MRQRTLLAALLMLSSCETSGLQLLPSEGYLNTSNTRRNMDAPTAALSVASTSRPICFTRFLIDVPLSAQVVFGRMTVNAEIDRRVSEAKNFDQLVSERVAQNREDARMFDQSGPIDQLAGKPIDSAVRGLKHVISITGYDSYDVDSFLRLGEDVFHLQGTGLPGAFVKRKLARHEEVARGLRSRGDAELPNQDGICLDGAFTQQDPDYENIQLGVRLSDHPDVHFSIQLMKNRDFLEREDEFQKRLLRQAQEATENGLGEWFSKIRYLRRGAREIAGWSGYEVAAHLPAGYGGKESHQFLFHSRGKKDDPLHPLVDIQFDTGVLDNKTRSAQPSLTDEEAIALWDKLLTSIRVRSTTPPQAGAPAPGLTLSEGELAPVDGWWECLSVNGYPPEIKVKGGMVQYFPQRVALPRVTLSRPGTFWQRLTGRVQTFQPSEKSSWRLVEVGSDRLSNGERK